MDGKTLNAGAVAGVKQLKIPISVARKVMDDTPHVMLSGKGASHICQRKRVRNCGPKLFLYRKPF